MKIFWVAKFNQKSDISIEPGMAGREALPLCHLFTTYLAPKITYTYRLFRSF